MKSKKLFYQESLASIREHEKSKNLLKDFLRRFDLQKVKLKKIEAELSGYIQSSKSGSGFDFNEIREYKIGDDLRHISWKTIAKTGKLHTKEYYTEKEVRAYFLIDISTSMFCGNKFNTFLNFFVFMLNKASTFCEKIGGVFFSNEIQYYFPFRETHSQANIMLQTFINYYHKLKDKTETKPVRTNLAQAINFTKQYFRRKGIVFLISDFTNLKDWEKSFFEISQKQNIFSFQIHDPIDFELHKIGYITLIDPETKQRFVVNTDSKRLHMAYKAYTKEKQKLLNNFLSTIGAKHIVIEQKDFIVK